MKVGLGLYRHMLTRDYHDFARQAGCTGHTPQMTCPSSWHIGMAHTIGFILAAQALLETLSKESGAAQPNRRTSESSRGGRS
jgi:hypothetical protein